MDEVNGPTAERLLGPQLASAPQRQELHGPPTSKPLHSLLAAIDAIEGATIRDLSDLVAEVRHQAVAVLGDARDDHEALGEAEREVEELRHAIMEVEEREADLSTVVAAMERAHERARHPGPWEFCSDPVCSAMEEWVHFAEQDGLLMAEGF